MISPPPSRRATVLASLLLIAVAAVLVAPTLRCPGCWSELYDWRYFQAMEHVFRTQVASYHQLPLWNPYACGGEVGIANPQSTALAPTLLLSLLLGTPLGLKAALFVYLLAALVGGFALARALGASLGAALVAGIAYGGSGWFAMHLATGHINFAGAALYPLLLLCYLKSLGPTNTDGDVGVDVVVGVDGDGDVAVSAPPPTAHSTTTSPARPSSSLPATWIFLLPAGALIAWMAALGGTYTVPMAIVLLGTLSATDAARRRSLRPLLLVAAIGAIALVLGAARFLPLLQFVTDHPRHVGEKDGNNAFDVARMFLAWRQKLEPVSGGHDYWWHEYCCHLPYLALPLAAFAALHKSPSLRRPRVLVPTALFFALTLFAMILPGLERQLGRDLPIYRDAYHLLGVAVAVLLTLRTPVFRFVPVAIVGLGIVAGTAWPHGPWWLIRHLPLYRDLRVPARYLIVVALVASLLAARGLDALASVVTSRRGAAAGRALVAAVVALVVVETVLFNWPAYVDARFTMDVDPATPPPPFHQVEGEWRAMLTGILGGHGVLKCDEEAPLQRGELDPGDVDQVRLLDPSAGTVRQADWSPNQIRLELELTRPTDVLINQNWNEHWHASDSTGAPVEVVSVAGRLGVRPSPTLTGTGRATVVLEYRPRSFVIGAWLSAVSLPLALLVFLAGLLHRRRAARA